MSEKQTTAQLVENKIVGSPAALDRLKRNGLLLPEFVTLRKGENGGRKMCFYDVAAVKSAVRRHNANVEAVAAERKAKKARLSFERKKKREESEEARRAKMAATWATNGHGTPVKVERRGMKPSTRDNGWIPTAGGYLAGLQNRNDKQHAAESEARRIRGEQAREQQRAVAAMEIK